MHLFDSIGVSNLCERFTICLRAETNVLVSTGIGKNESNESELTKHMVKVPVLDYSPLAAVYRSAMCSVRNMRLFSHLV